LTAAAVLAQLTTAGCRLTLRPDGRISLRPAPPPALLALAREHRDELARLVAATHASAGTPSVEATPEPPPTPRPTRPGVCPGDPPAPAVDPDASRTLTILELAGAHPSLQPDGTLVLAHPERASSDLRAEARQHQDDICALLAYRALLEQLWPVTAEPLPPPTPEFP
jgi:hypothetical protein